MKKIISILTVIAMLMSCVGIAAADSTASVTFSDVDAQTSTGAAIYKLAANGVVNGCGDGTFNPNGSLTRAELCKMVNLVFGYKDAAEENFSDVNANDWFYSYVAVAKKAGYIAGCGDGLFHGKDNLTREQVCVILARVAKLYDIPYTGTVADAVSPWAKDAVTKVLANRIMSVDANGNFRATQNITRGELAVVLSSFVLTEGENTGETGNTGNTGNTTPNNGGTGGNTTGGNSSGGGSIGGGGSTGGGSTGGGGSTSGGGSSGGGSTGDITTTYTVTFDANGGTPKPSAQTIAKGGYILVPSVTKEGYIFDGWYSGSTKVDASTPITGNIKLTAKWIEDETVDEAKQKEVTDKIKLLISELGKIRFNSKENEIISIIKTTMNSVLADAESGKKVYVKDYVLDNYGANIESAQNLYKAMNETEQIDFKSKLLELDQSVIDDLSMLLFGVENIEDYID